MSFSSTARQALTKNGTVRINTYDIYDRQTCQLTEYNRTVRNYKKVHQDQVGSGKENQHFKKIVDSSLFYRERVRTVELNMTYSNLQGESGHRQGAATLIDVLTIIKDNYPQTTLSWKMIKR